MTIKIIPTPPVAVRPYDIQIDKYQRINPIGTMMVDMPTREVGGGFASAGFDSVALTAANVGAGSGVAVANSIGTLTSGTANNGYATLNTNAVARFQFTTANLMRGNFRLPALGGANTTRSWGAFNFGTKPAIQDGYYFSYDGSTSTLSLNTSSGGVVSNTVSSGSFNGEVSSYTFDTNVHTCEIIYQVPNVWFFIDSVLLHKFRATTAPLVGNIHVGLSGLVKNSAIGTVSVQLEAWAANLSKMSATEPGPQFFHINTLSTNVIKLGPGTMQRMCINTPGTASNAITIYDNTAGSGKVIASFVASAQSSAVEFDYNVPFFTGLTVVSATGTSADVTIVYD